MTQPSTPFPPLLGSNKEGPKPGLVLFKGALYLIQEPSLVIRQSTLEVDVVCVVITGEVRGNGKPFNQDFCFL